MILIGWYIDDIYWLIILMILSGTYIDGNHQYHFGNRIIIVTLHHIRVKQIE